MNKYPSATGVMLRLYPGTVTMLIAVMTIKKAARKFRQEQKYNGISSLLPIRYSNHKLLEKLSYKKQESWDAEELESEGLDFSLYRRLYPDPKNSDWIRLNFGSFSLDSTDDFQTFKLTQNETEIRRLSRP